MSFFEKTLIDKTAQPHETGTIVVHLCDNCNLRCRFCHWPRHDAHMSVSAFARVVERDYDMLVFCGKGEPTYHPNYKDILLAVPRDDTVNLVTNGTVYPDGDDRWLRKINNVRISLDAGSSGVYSKLKGEALFGRVTANIDRYVRNDIHTGVSFVVLPDNISDIPAFLRWGYSQSNRATNDFYLQFNSPRYSIRCATDKQLSSVLAVVQEEMNWDSGFQFFVKKQTNLMYLESATKSDICDHQPGSNQCFLMLNSVQMTADLDVYPCSAAIKNKSHLMGNLNRDSWDVIRERIAHRFHLLNPPTDPGCHGCWDDHINRRMSAELKVRYCAPCFGSREALSLFRRHR